MFAVVTMVGVLSLMGLLVLLVLTGSAFVYWLGQGGFIGWWLATDMFNTMGEILKWIGLVIASMISPE
jgi:hypothetical protein